MIVWLAMMSVGSAADLTVQARLLDADGTPVQSGTNVEVVLFDAATGVPPATVQLFSASASLASLSDGYLSVVLSDVPESVLGAPAWVEFRVDTVPMGARQPLTAVPLAAAAEWVVTPTDALQPHQGALRLPDGSPLVSCAAYKAHAAWRGEDWQRFWVDPDGAGAVAPMAVLCDMDGGWAVWQAETGPWGWDRDGRICYDLTLFTEGQAWQMSRYTHSEHAVFTDADFWFQEDDSVNTGSVTARSLASIADPAAFNGSTSFTMDYTTTSSNHVHITWSDAGFDRITATCAEGSSGCGARNIPSDGSDSEPLFLLSIDANPRCSGSSATGNDFRRNGTAFQGSRYEVRLR